MQDETDLETMLRRAGIPLQSWGRGEAKTLGELWRELRVGDCELGEHDGRLERRVRVVQVEIRRPTGDGGTVVLVEAEQVLADGRRRRRGLLPAEKMRLDEEPVVGALRCMAEELGVEEADVHVDADGITEHASQQTSPSYPGLETRYVFYRVPVRCDVLPDHDWVGEETGDAVTRHHWQWWAQAPSP